jgi:pimeloyl-ACP methyl ester carboxylesterase
MPGWFSVIEREPLLRVLLASPLPLPEAVLRARSGRSTASWPSRARARHPRRSSARSPTTTAPKEAVVRILDNGRRLLPELEDPYRLDRIDCPVLLVWGDRDRMVTHRGARRLTEAVAGTTYELLEGSGHCPQIEAAEPVARLLLEFAAAPRRRAA